MANEADHVSPQAPNGRFGIAALQLPLSKGNNLEQIAAEIAAICRVMPWVRMVVLPELAAFGANLEQAESMPGPTEEHFADLARRHDIWLIPGSIYRRDGDRVLNTAPIIDPSGTVIARYDKLFPFLPYEQGVTAGTVPTVFDVPGVGRFGLSICYDKYFPETTRSLISLGAEVILSPTMTYTIDRDIELAITRAAAATNQCYYIDINNAGDLGTGRSIVCGPGGEVIHQAASGREIIAFEVDLAYLRDVRERGWQCLAQPLKSFRDSNISYPAYGAGAAPSDALARLGPLAKPGNDRAPRHD